MFCARFARAKGRRRGSFFGFAEKRTTFPSLARDAKNAFRLCPPLNYLVTRSLRSHEGGQVVRFLGKARKTNHILLFCERSELWAK
ncbi:MAG: hypothetical protein U5L45_02650 [Saprospiraceae bacterium]|nr:hypothetical protein [Saprospiraceae bacterium]